MTIIPSVEETLIKSCIGDSRINILKVFKGEIAVEKIKRLFFKEGQEEKSNEWINQWSPLLRLQSAFVIYSYTPGSGKSIGKSNKTSTIHFKYCIGYSGSGSCLGESYKYNEAIEKLIYLMN